MADFTLTRPDLFPDDTEVGAYPASNWPSPAPPSGAPVGTATDEVEVEDGSAAFTGLDADTTYFAVGEVAEDEFRYVSFFTATANSSGGETLTVGPEGDIPLLLDGEENPVAELIPESTVTVTKDAFGLVRIRGSLKKVGGTQQTTAVMTLPEGFRPEQPVVLYAYYTASVLPNGLVYPLHSEESLTQGLVEPPWWLFDPIPTFKAA